MLRALFGSRSAERILFFLLVNESCYSHQLYQALDLALSPIQNTLQRLEKGRILTSHQDGKRVIYQFNRKCPFIDEIEKLLQQAFHQLSIEDKKMYYSAKGQSSLKKSDRQNLSHLWKELSKVSRVKLIASSPSWSGVGEGEVQVIKKGLTLELIESGHWKGAQSYRNHFRFCFLRDQGMIALEHLRFGKNHPEFLFNFILVRPGILESTDPHLGGEDVYKGRLSFNQLFIELQLKTIGPKKNERIESIYT